MTPAVILQVHQSAEERMSLPSSKDPSITSCISKEDEG